MKCTTYASARWILAGGLAVLVLTSAADAQRRSGPSAPAAAAAPKPGFLFGVYLQGAPGVAITSEDVEFNTTFGPGAGLMAGYAFNRTFSGYVSLDVAKQGSGISFIEGSFGLSHIEIGARANIPTPDPLLRPYVTASIGRRSLGARVTNTDEHETFNWSIAGSMLAVGGGFERRLSPTMSLDGGLTLGFGAFNQINDDGERWTTSSSGSTSVRLRFGVVWRPSPTR